MEKTGTSYLYCYQNPVKFVDPTGMEGGPWDDLVTWGNKNNVGTRVIGGIQMVGGVYEAIAGGVGGVLTAETGVGAVIGYLVLINGIDNTVTGAKQMWTGQTEHTLLNQGISAGSEALGASPQTAQEIANWGEFGVTAGLNTANSKNIMNANKSLTPTINTTTVESYVNTKSNQEAKYKLSPPDELRIKNAATRINKAINVVGSRASGTAGANSDWDYIIEGITSKEWSKIKNSLPGSRSILDNTPKNIDLLKTPVDKTKPHITINL